jgi:hypothetical protein
LVGGDVVDGVGCGLGSWLAHGIELIEPIRPIDHVALIGNVNALPPIAHEVGGLEYGP